MWPSSRPAPTATLVTPGFNVSSILSDNVNHSPAGSDGLVETTLTVEFVPDASHHGKAISCKAEQHNGDQRLLYEVSHLLEITHLIDTLFNFKWKGLKVLSSPRESRLQNEQNLSDYQG